MLNLDLIRNSLSNNPPGLGFIALGTTIYYQDNIVNEYRSRQDVENLK
jgi:hypothetical protein